MGAVREKAIEEGEKSVQVSHNSVNAMLNLALIYAAAGRIEASEKLLNELLSKTAEACSPGWVGDIKFVQERKKKHSNVSKRLFKCEIPFCFR